MTKPIFFVLLLCTLACGKRGKEQKQAIVVDDVIAVRTEPVMKANAENHIVASGLVGSSTEARPSFKTGGIIEKIYVKEGQNVAKGQLLASLNLTEINAGVQQAQEAVNKAERDLKRVSNLYADSISTLEQVQNLSTALAVAKQNLQIAQYNRSYSQIHSPIAGTIVKKLMNEGELIGPGSPVVFIASNQAGDWILKAGVTDFDWARLNIGDRAQVQMGAFPDQSFSASLSNLSQAPDPSSGLYQAELRLSAQGKKLASGLFGTAKIYPSGAALQSSVSVNALIEGSNNHAFVYIIDAHQKAKKLPVEVAYIAKDRAYLKNIPAELSSVITDGSAYLVDGSKVKLVKAE